MLRTLAISPVGEQCELAERPRDAAEAALDHGILGLLRERNGRRGATHHEHGDRHYPEARLPAGMRFRLSLRSWKV